MAIISFNRRSQRHSRFLRSITMLLCCASSSMIYGDRLYGEKRYGDEPSVFVAIIIDDLGHNKDRGEQAISLPGSVTYAVLPNSRYATAISESAFSSDKEVIVHLPMENRNSFPMSVDALTDKLNRDDFLISVNTLIKKVPHAIGINNHQGSYLTEQSVQMTWLMDDLKTRNFFFLDSRTSPKTVAYNIALNKDLLSGSRDVFLDNERTTFEIDKAFQKLIKIAKRRGTAIGIGHPHTQTLDYLAMAIPHLREQGVELVPASNIMNIQNIQRLAKQKTTSTQATVVLNEHKQTDSTTR